MSAQDDQIKHIQLLVQSGHYRVRIHAVRHMIAEGFDERQLVEALNGPLHLIEAYTEEVRYLVLGTFHFTQRTRSPLHILCDVSNPAVLDIVTAYIPQQPWWTSPTQRRKRVRRTQSDQIVQSVEERYAPAPSARSLNVKACV